MEQMILSTGIGAALLCVIAVWFVRFIKESGCLQKDGCFNRLFYTEPEDSGLGLLRKEVFTVFTVAVLIRLLVYLVSVVVGMLFSEENGVAFSLQSFFELWERWDAGHYIGLAQKGYEGYTENGQHLFLVFFPLYPWMVRILNMVFGNWQFCCLFLSTLAFCIGSVYFFGFVKEEFGTEIARKAYALLVCYPFAFFFGGMMTESLFFCLVSAGFFYCRRHKWWLVGVISLFAALCRIQGVLLFGVGMVEFFVAVRPFELLRKKQGRRLLKEFFTKAVWLFLAFAGSLIYFGLNYAVEGDWFAFQTYQKEHWYHTTTWIGNCLGEIIGYVFSDTVSVSSKTAIWIPEFILFIVAFVCIVYGLRRQSLKNEAFLIVYLLVNYSITFLISGGRYMLCALPMFIILAQIGKKYKWIYNLCLFSGLLLQGIFLAGFLMGCQIM